MRKYLSFILLLIGLTLQAQETYKTVKDISYIPAGETDGYRKERCKLDVYYPVGKKGFPTIVWFHGGGLEGGGKHVPEMFMNQGFAVVAVNYRLSPKAQNPAYTEDAAAAVAWAYKHIEEYGGSPRRVFVTGHSAGGYLTLMVGLDKSYLQEYGVDADSIAAYLPISGQTVTHFTIRKERSLPEGIPVIDQYAPCNKARKDIPKNIGNKKVSLYELQGFDHGQVYVPGCCLVANYIRNFIADGR